MTVAVSLQRLLLVEDNPGDAELITDLLSMGFGGHAFAIQTVSTIAAAREALGRDHFDAILLDLGLPDGSGLTCLSGVQTRSGDTPIIVLTGLESEDVALDCIAAGAQTYVSKHDLRVEELRRAVAYSVVRKREAEARRRSSALSAQLRHVQKLHVLGSLAAGVAHDLGNTLQPIFNTLPLLKTRIVDPRGADEIRIVETGLGHAKQLLGRFVDISRREAEAVEPVLLNEFVEGVVPLLTAGVPGRIEIRASGEIVPEVLIDQTRLYQVVLNLVSNAAKAIGNRPGSIDIRVRSDQDRAVILSVEDSGCGMDDETRARMFDPFFTTERAEGSAGLGLSIVMTILNEAGGTIDVFSIEGEGTRVELRFPAAAPC